MMNASQMCSVVRVVPNCQPPNARSDSCCCESAMSYAQAQFIAENLESHEQQLMEIRSLVLTSQQASL